MSISDESKQKKNQHEVDKFGKKPKPQNKQGWIPKKDDDAKVVIKKLAYIVALLVLIFSIVVLVDYYHQEIQTKNLNDKLQSTYSSLAKQTTTIPQITEEVHISQPLELLPAAVEMLSINSDTVGWINVPNTQISLPVVQRHSEDGNDFYLTRNFNGQRARSGAIFADYRTLIRDKSDGKVSDNIVLYGHNEANGTMFGELSRYKEKNGKRWTDSALDFYKQNPTFTFNTNYETGEYKIFAYFVTAVEPYQDETDEIFDYINYVNFDEKRYNQFIDNVSRRNKLITDIDTKFGDQFVTLSTCSNEFEPSRFVVIGRKVRVGEKSTVNVDNAKLNHNAQEPDWDTIYNR